MVSQSSNNVISDLEEFGFKINWTLLKLGYEGNAYFPRIISATSISEYAQTVVETMETGYELIVRLISPETSTEFEDVLGRLSESEHVNQLLQVRKLRAYIVCHTIRALPSDYFRGLLELTELWISLHLPDDEPYPHIIQGRNNTLTPQEYYTQQMYDRLLDRHRNWLKEEIASILLLDKA
jgi:hypothetical protein